MSDTPQSQAVSVRARSLDALRGLAILLMVLSGIVPFRVLPSWMYHAQLPPPTNAFNPELAGLTWVDLVFPMFLFAMGAAIPLALGRKLAQSVSSFKIHAGIIERGFMLAFFAIFLQHIRPFTINADPDAATWLFALAGFLTLFAIYVHPPKTWSAKAVWVLRGLGWISAIWLLYIVVFPDGSGFKLTRSDIIIIVLANMAVFGAWVWLATKNNLILRLGIMAVLFGCILSAGTDGWVKSIWDSSPAPWVFRFYYLKYLFIIIPGIIAGEQLLKWQESLQDGVGSGWETWRYTAIVAISILIILACLMGLQSRAVVATVIVCLLASAMLLYLVHNPISKHDFILKSVLQWGVFWLFLGLAFEPYEGGIKKDWSTFSYYFVTSGVTVLMLVSFMIVLDLFKKSAWVPLLVENGQNPMLAYVGMMNLIYPILGLTGLDVLIQSITPTPWLGVLRAIIYTILLAWIVAVFTRKRIFWKT